MKIKLSGITCEEDATWASNIGVDYLTYSIVQNDPQKVSEKMLKSILESIPPYIKSVIRIGSDNDLKVIEKISKDYQISVEFMYDVELKKLQDLKDQNVNILDTKSFLSYELIWNTQENMTDTKMKKQLKEIFEDKKPYGLDINEHVSRTTKKKDPDKLFELVKTIKKL